MSIIRELLKKEIVRSGVSVVAVASVGIVPMALTDKEGRVCDSSPEIGLGLVGVLPKSAMLRDELNASLGFEPVPNGLQPKGNLRGSASSKYFTSNDHGPSNLAHRGRIQRELK